MNLPVHPASCPAILRAHCEAFLGRLSAVYELLAEAPTLGRFHNLLLILSLDAAELAQQVSRARGLQLEEFDLAAKAAAEGKKK